MRFKVRPHRAIHFAGMRRRHHAKHDVRSFESRFQSSRDFHFLGQLKPGKINFVDSPPLQKIHKSALWAHNANGEAARTRQCNGQRGTPAPAANDGDFLHDFFRPISKGGSVPIISRSILSRCFMMTTTAASSVPVETAVGRGVPRRVEQIDQ